MVFSPIKSHFILTGQSRINDYRNTNRIVLQRQYVNHLILLNPFPLIANLQQTTLKTIMSDHETIITEKSWKRCGKRWNCSFWAISPFVKMRKETPSAVNPPKCIYTWERAKVLKDMHYSYCTLHRHCHVTEYACEQVIVMSRSVEENDCVVSTSSMSQPHSLVWICNIHQHKIVK